MDRGPEPFRVSAVRANDPPSAELSELLEARLSARIVSHAGIVLPAWVLRARVRERMTALVMNSAYDYTDLIESSAGRRELDSLLELVRVGETRFFRHTAHVQALTDTVVPALRARRSGGPVRVWSAACASGEEAYTLAIALSGLLPHPGYQVSVLATDMSARAIAMARRGEYSAEAIARVPEPMRMRAFRPVVEPSESPQAPGGQPRRYRVTPELAGRVRFERHNLVDGGYPTDMDIIWCRNVFIYFSPDARVQVARKLAASLNPDGVLFIGYAENLRDMPEFATVRTAQAVIYRRADSRPAQSRTTRDLHTRPRSPGQTQPAASAHPTSAHPTSAHPTSAHPASAHSTASKPDSTDSGLARRVTAVAPPGSVATVELSGRYDGSERMSSALSAAMSGDPQRVIVDLDRVEFLADKVAPLLRRAGNAARATGVEFELRATRPGIVRFLHRHGLHQDIDDRCPGGDGNGRQLGPENREQGAKQ